MGQSPIPEYSKLYNEFEELGATVLITSPGFETSDETCLCKVYCIYLAGNIQQASPYVLTHSAIRPIGQWDATAGWAGPYTNGANDRPIHQSGDHNNILILLFHTDLWNILRTHLQWNVKCFSLHWGIHRRRLVHFTTDTIGQSCCVLLHGHIPTG